MIKLGVSGARGRMGQRIIRLAKEDKDFKVVFGLERSGHCDAGKIIEEVAITTSLEKIADCDCLIDFSSSTAVLEHLKSAVKFRKPIVIGTTGLDESQQEKITETARDIAVVFAPNMSVGVNLVFRLLSDAAKVLGGYKVYMEEAHHVHKKDAPSGTAKKMAQIINSQGFDVKNEDINAIRENEIVGDHKVAFESGVDKIEISHSAKTRDIFAKGALLAAKWVVEKPAGLYSMEDVLF